MAAPPAPPPPAAPVGQAPLGNFNSGAQAIWGPPPEAPPEPNIVPIVTVHFFGFI
jgi:hypothetical protein